MHILKQETAPRYTRPEGITSYLLASPRTSNGEHLTTTLVGRETEQVGPGDCVFIPSGQPHSLRNDGETALRYFSAAAPAFLHEDLKTFWPLQSEAETKS